VQAAEQILNLQIDNYAKVNLRGFIQFVNALGGVRVNVNERLPIGGSTENTRATKDWIEPGRNQLLNGYQAMWYARSRWSTNDFDRMRRQRCVIAAVTQQADPARVALNLPRILSAARDNVRTDIALKDLDAWVTLTMRVKNASVRSLPFTSEVIDTTDPDFDKIHALVARSLQPPRAAPAPATPKPSATRTPSPPRPSAPAGNPTQAQDVKSVC
jgi:anionic cell wall polymer biosynthesis LytR-Cps2A-Psr (LCP) family protein